MIVEYHHDIQDDQVFAAVEAMRDEMACWRTQVWNPEGPCWAIRDRLPLPMPGEEVVIKQTFERHDFPSEQMARDYILWRSVKAALEIGR